MPTDRKPGRPRDPVLEMARATIPELSPRTQARYARALKMMHRADVPSEVQHRIIERCTRPNGSMNIAAFEREAEATGAMTILERWSRGEFPS